MLYHIRLVAVAVGAVVCAAGYALWPGIGHEPPPIVNLSTLNRGVSRERITPTHLEFEKRILDGSKVGLLFPAFGNFDGDGKIDMVVGVDGGRAARLPQPRDQRRT